MKQKEVSNIGQNTFTSCLEINKKFQPFQFSISKGKPYGV